jgi:hypothetical protein
MTVGIISSLIAGALAFASRWMWKNRTILRICWVTYIIKRHSEIRVSMAALLRVYKSGQYLLFHVPFVPDTYGPPGGVIKFLETGRKQLDQLEFRGEVVLSLASDMERDLRGFLPAQKLVPFLRWFNQGEGRETAEDCLRRELREELAEVGFPNTLDNFEILRFNRVRLVSEGPNSVRNAPYLLLRVIAVYDLDFSHLPSADAYEKLLQLAGKGDRVVFASTAEISRGRSGRAIIGSQACLLYGTTRSRDDPAAISS